MMTIEQIQTWRIHCSQIGKIMGDIGLTETQKKRLDELSERHLNPMAKALTENMINELAYLLDKHNNPELPDTAKSYLRECYANDNEIIFSKYTDKGNQVEAELIEFAAHKLGYGMAEKNQVRMADEYFDGECDIDFPDLIVDVKASWNRKTLQENAIKTNSDYFYQGQGYMHLYKKDRFILFYGLMNTPEDANCGFEITYDDMPDEQRWMAFEYKAQSEIILDIIERVKLCRKYLLWYHELVGSKMGRVNGV